MLLAVVQTPPQSIADVKRTLQAIEAVCVDGDGLKWFNWLYLQVTDAVGARVAAGGFSDPAWLAALDVQFARLYFGALETALSGGTAAGSWRAVFQRRNQTAIARIQFALAGINAHINYDLPIAIVNTGPRPEHGDVHYKDYTALNTTLDSLVESAKRTLGVRLLGDALPPATHLGETIAAFKVRAARETAWNNAQLLWEFRKLPLATRAMLDGLDGITTVISKTLLVPVPFVDLVAADSLPVSTSPP
jgi:Family of unknown function (DUF5995)